MYYYAVAKGHNIGIYNFWNDCKEQILGYSGAIYKKFTDEEDAENFILNCSSVNSDILYNIYNKYDDKLVDKYIYTDGSCINNGKINSLLGIGVYIDDKSDNISKVYDNIEFKHILKTNNTAELLAIINAYYLIQNELENKKICIVTDSEYSIKCATTYGEKCEKNKWSKNIPNKELIIELYNIYKSNNNLKLKHVKAHTNNDDIHSIGNAKADKLAYNSIKNYIRINKINKINE